ncbi:lipoyl synthase [Desulfomonile tiedjei]|uniref:Multifunctional fusion protein n=1 Tax=Desulfomonile tiedjei (strain ATCC 49306 / DSM 6799 / DCB-1) TaxID=706587 RepID=I4C1N8_DESTA|nr:lipoyl synthase [Desulfomonile tiedjei]AFM23479.1 lipoate-protein ligase B/lipoate synthase [Desulfomonile tiedjei DSM 6799]
MTDASISHLQVLDWGLLIYDDALKLQEALVSERIAELSPDRLILVEHPPVVTIGRSGSLDDLRESEEAINRKGASVFHVDRGGMATFHGPGQLVAYPIVKLQTKDLRLYLQMLLETVAAVLRSYGLASEFRGRNPGVWAGAAKIASVGVACRRWVTYHGIALNVNADLRWFESINPCGDPDGKVTSMERELGQSVDMAEVKDRFTRAFCRIFGYATPPEVRQRPTERPSWLVLSPSCTESIDRMESVLSWLRLSTVCQSARCPNLGECFARGTATFMILGTICTRTCRFCAVDKGKPDAVDGGEPERIAQAVQLLRLKHAVITSVTRDDLPDGGAEHFVRTVEKVRECCPDVSVEVLVPDFRGSLKALQRICDIRPDVFNHNVETVKRLYPIVRPKARYQRSLGILEYAGKHGLIVKSGIMLGLGETEQEILEAITDLRRTGCSFLTLGQYLAPSKEHFPVSRYVSPAEFEEWAQIARSEGFKKVAAGPLVRSSYRAGEMVCSMRQPLKSYQSKG